MSAPAAIGALREGWRVQRRATGALILREALTRYGRHNIGFLWLFVEPMLFTLGVTALWTITRAAHASHLPIAAFALTGYSSVLLWRNMPGRCIAAFEPNRSLFYHRTVRLIDIFAARLLLEFGGATIALFVLATLFWQAGLIDPPRDTLLVIAGWLMLAWFGAALAVLLGSLAMTSDLVERLWHPASYLVFPLSGAAFMVDALPQRAQAWAQVLPMVDGVELVREGWFGASAHAHHDMAYMAAVTLLLSFAGLVRLRQAGAGIVVE